MAFTSSKPLPAVILDEIGLEGLEGITISGLWIRLADTLQLPLPLLDKFQVQVWKVLLQAHTYFEFFQLPKPREKLKVWDRFSITDPDYGLPITMSECPFTIYKSVPIADCDVLGSCESYDVRVRIPFDEVAKMSLKQIEEKWGDSFVIVGNQKLRYHCLVPPNISIPTEITAIQYCVLEFIGRSRKNGISSAGPYSILHCCKDSAIGFYIRNKLLRLGLITKQAYTEKRNDRLISSSLLTLTRFHTQNKTAFIVVIEKMYLALKHAPHQRMTLNDVRHLFPVENQTMIKKILLTHFFRKHFETCNIRARDLLPNFKPTPKMNMDREVACVRLKNPNLSEDELFNEDDEIDEKGSNDFFDYKHSFADMPLPEEIYRAVEKCGSGGCSQSQLCAILSMNHLNVRQALKKALADKIVTSYCKDMGRQRTNMLVAANCSNSVQKVKQNNINITKNLKCIEEPNIPIDQEPQLKDIVQITATIKQVKHDNVVQSMRDETAKQIERKQKIVEVLNERCIIQVPTLRQEIIRCELEAGYKDEICNKSLYRSIARLQNVGVLKFFEIMLRFEENARIYRYITHPKISADHNVLAQEVIKLKNALFLYLEDRKFRTNPVRPGEMSKQKESPIGIIPAGPHKSPKFLTARFLHEFMYYMLFQLSPNHQPLELSEDVLKTWLQSEPNIDFADLYKSMINEHIVPYRERINWRTFINPLPVYDGKPSGWISLPDVVDRMPFSMLNKIIHVPPGVDPLALEFLLHPIRQHYLIKHLPLSLQALINRGRLGRIIVNIVRILQRMGLIQVSEKGGKDALQLWVYVNRKATVMDTTTSEAGYLKVNPDREYSEIKFELNSYADVQHYWNCLHKICVHTKLGFVHKNVKLSRTPTMVLYKLRRNELNFIVAPVAAFEEAPLLDTGKTPGDGLGAGGIASGLYSSFQRNWTWLVNNKHTAAAATQKLKKGTKFIRTKMSKLMTTVGNKKSTGTPPTMTVKKVNRFTITSAGRVIKRKGTIVQKQKKSAIIVDSIDRDALKQMRSLRARWSTKEDLILKMTRATFLFLGVPVIHFSHRDVARITRDLIRILCGIHNKTTQACHRRIQFLIRANRHLPELPTWLHALQTNEHLSTRYEGDRFLRDLRELYSTKADFQNAIFVHFLYTFGKLQTLINLADPQENGLPKSNFPATLTEFYKKFRECSPLNESKTLLHFNPTTKIELQLVTINDVLHSSLCCFRDKTQYNLQIFEVFKTFPEDILHAAFKRARIDGLVVARKKGQIKTYTTQQLTGPSYVFSNKYRLSLMFLRIPYLLFDMHHAFFDQLMKAIYAADPTAIEIKSPHSAQLFLIGELLWSNYINIDIKTPSNMLTVDPSAQQTCVSASERIFDHYHTLLENAPQTEYLKQFDALGELATRVKFKAANEKYVLHYNPFDVVCKLNTVQIHFFCFLGNLNRSVDMTLTQYDKESENFCPFTDCVMMADNYLIAIEQVIAAQGDELEKIKINENKEMEADTEKDSTTIGVDNLMAVFEKFESFMNDKLAKNELKDLGKIIPQRKPLDLIGICKDIANVGVDDDMTNNDEFEPAMNKEEKNARAQDAFVVCLPTLKISSNDEVLEGVEKAKYKGVMMPEMLLESATQRDQIFDTIFENTYWTYTQNNLDTLKTVMDSNEFSDAEQEQVVQIHNFIESCELGAHASDLLEKFPDIDFLQRALKLLRQHYLVLRAGVSSFMYVQKNYVRHWVIHTRHIKRLVRESMGKLVPPQKRKNRSDEDDNEDGENVAKHSRANEEGRRISKPVERFEDRTEVTTSTLAHHNDVKDLLILKPCPWIRVNGSLNRRVLDKWMASILIECTVQSGCTIHSLSLRFKQMPAVHIMFLLELMVDLKIVELRSYKRVKVGLSSQFKELEISSGNEFTDPRNTYVITAPDAITRMSLFIGDKQYRMEFI